MSENTLFFINYNIDYNLFFNTKHNNWEHFIAPVKMVIFSDILAEGQIFLPPCEIFILCGKEE